MPDSQELNENVSALHSVVLREHTDNSSFENDQFLLITALAEEDDRSFWQFFYN
ncbi:hypothetical protein OAP63_06910 [Vibrio sp.]|uniref:hypothetical protein n=1 Tax=Vibrio viridaestus TaxID=2487322 RepID=UPI00140784E1|nr:hypothetical protein [Vibrio viridaestus]MDC0610448.1 hypothetical protein [Vibrio sp.]